ncbi:MAG: TonB-dependent receptor [Alphaproteobacteria bacterium]
MSYSRLSVAATLAPLILALGVAPAQSEDAEAPEVSALVVTARRDVDYGASRTSTATRTDTPLRDVPQSVSVITDQLIRDQSIQNLSDVFRYVPGVGVGQGEGHRDAPTIRGNATTADFFVNGVRDDVQYIRDLYNVERVEVLKGPNAMIFGRGGGGGVINRVTKTADGSDERKLSAELGSWNHNRFTLDMSQPLDDGVSGRVVGLFQRSESFRDFVNLERWGINPSVSWRNADGLTISMAYEHFEDDRTTDRGVPSFNGRPSPAPRSAFFGDPERSYSTTNIDVVNLAMEYELSANLTLRNRTVYGDYAKTYDNIFPAGAAVAGPNGAPATYPLQAYRNISPRDNLFNQTDVVWKTTWGGMSNTILAGLEFGRQRTENLRLTGRFGAANGPTTLAGNPFTDPVRRGLPIVFSNAGADASNRVKVTVAAAYVQNQVELTSQWQLLAGLRYDRFEVEVQDRRATVVGRRDFSRRDGLWSPRLGLVYKPVTPISIYGSYSVSYLPASGDQFSSLTTITEGLKPETFENLEVGAKWEINPNLLVTGALYQLDRDNTTSPDPARPGQVVLTGAQRSRGLEVSVAGRLSSRWEVAGGYALQDAEIRRATAAAPAGRDVALVPKQTFSLWNRYDVTPVVSVGLGLIHQGARFASISNAVTLPAFTRADIAVFLKINERVRGQINVENLFDSRYVATSHGDNNILFGTPRSVRASMDVSF